jgi:RNA polymerase sigma-70 factor (ECF subfamily)
MIFEPLPAMGNVVGCGGFTQRASRPLPMGVRGFSRQGAGVFPMLIPPVTDGFKANTVNPVTLMDNSEEKQIIDAILAGHVDQFVFLVERYQKPIYSFMLRLTRSRDDAEELTQAVFVRAFEKLRKFNNDRRFFPWLYTIAFNHYRDHQRKKGLRRNLFAETHQFFQWQDPTTDDCKTNPECVTIVSEIVDAMEKLPLSYQEPLLLYYREEFSVKEIAAALGISGSAVKVRLYRGRKMLNRLMGEHYAKN